MGWPVGAPLSLMRTSAASWTAVVGSWGPSVGVGEVLAEGVVGVAGGSADADLHEAGRAGGVRDPGAGGAWLEGA